MKQLFNFVTLVFLLALFALPIMAQDTPSPELPAWALGLPAVLSGLVFANYRLTEGFKRFLASENTGYTPPKDIQAILVMLFSVLVGIGSAWITPNSTDWLGDYASNPLFAILLTGFSVSTLGAGVHEIFKRLGGNSSVYKTTTEISAMPTDSAAPKETMNAISQAVKS